MQKMQNSIVFIIIFLKYCFHINNMFIYYIYIWLENKYFLYKLE